MTDPELHARASELFLAIRELAAEARDAELRRRTDGDRRLSEEVSSLLAHDVADSSLPTDLDVPESIGPYRIVRRIGRGSSGQVFLAEQEQPIRRRVAVKIVPLAAFSPELAARFDLERRVLEQTEHENIARILDAGRTSGGLPFIVMDYVEGPPITAYCERERLAFAERIALVLEVADAVQHAHQRGVIHRDLKPANILVSQVDGRARPRVVDFGIARPVPGTFVGAGIFAQESPPTSGLPIGTPSYMAPEQTGLGPIDTRADVYGLGAVLYELVAGRPPLRLDDFGDAHADPVAALQRIRDVVPPPVSRARRESGIAAAAVHVGPSQLADLDAVLGKCLEKSPDRRYATVAAFADDLRRILRHEPVDARAPSAGYRMARFARRNRALVAAGVLVALGATVGVAGLGLGLARARREQREAVAQSESQRAVNHFLTDDLLMAASPDREGQQVTVKDLLQRASRRIDERFAERPLVAASIHQALGNAYAELGAYDDAERHIAQALALRRAFAGVDAPDTVRSEIAAASLLVRRARLDEAEARLSAAVVRARAVLGPDDADLYNALNDLGVCLESRGKLDLAVAALEEALAGRRRLFDPANHEVLTTTGNLALALDGKGETERSLALMLDALRAAESAPETARFTVLGLCNNIGATYQDLGRDREAEPYLKRASEIAAEVLGPDHPDTLTIRANLAGLESKLGDPERAIEIYRGIVAARTADPGPSAPETLLARHGYWDCVRLAKRSSEAADGFRELQADVDAALGEAHPLAAQTASSLARCLYDAGRLTEALPAAELAVARLSTAFGADHVRTRTAADLLSTLRALNASPK